MCFLLLAQFGQVWAPVGLGVDVIVGVDVARENGIGGMGVSVSVCISVCVYVAVCVNVGELVFVF